MLEGEAPAGPMYSERLDAAKDATRKYYRALERMAKIGKENQER
jgi:hypothetical protein